MADPRPIGQGTGLRLTLPGTVIVATEELLGYRGELGELLRELHTDSALLAYLAREPWLAVAGRPAVAELFDAKARLDEAARAATDLVAAIDESIASYSAAEARIQADQQKLAATIAALSGPAAWLLLGAVIQFAPALLATAAFSTLIGRLTGVDPLASMSGTLRDSGLLSDPAFVRALELAAVSLDDFGVGLMGGPPVSAGALGDEGLGLLGVDTSAAVAILAGGAVGVFRETAVRIDRAQVSTGGTAPLGAQERLGRIPEGDQVRIEKYEAAGMPPRWVVYVGPTETFSPTPGTEPWDLTSDVAGVANLSTGSLRATELAMREAGIGAGDAVQLVGFSQGGIVAARVAESGDWNVAGLETFGAPTGTVDLPADLPGIQVRHTDDLVPALGGPHPVTGQVQVERRAYPDGVNPSGDMVPAHHREAYATTARLMDASTAPELRRELDRLDAFVTDYTDRDGTTVTTTVFHAVRTPTSAR